MDESAEKIERGYQAAAMLENPAFSSALGTLRDLYVKDWMAAATTEKREECHHKMEALSKLILELQSILTTGTRTRERLGLLQGASQVWRNMSG